MYVSVLTIILAAVLVFMVWVMRSNMKIKIMGETQSNANNALDIMLQEIKTASEIYTPTSIFDSTPGQLSLKTASYLPSGETASYIDFYICGTKVCFKKESQNPIALTSESVTVNKLVFSRVVTGSMPSIQVELEVAYNGASLRPESQSVVNLKSAAALRQW